MFSKDVEVEKEEIVVEDGKVFLKRTMVDTKTGKRYIQRRRERNDALQECHRRETRNKKTEWAHKKEDEMKRLEHDMEKALQRLETRALTVKQRANTAAEDVLREHERLRELLDMKQKQAMQKIQQRKREQLQKLKEAHTQIRENYKTDVQAIAKQFEKVDAMLAQAKEQGSLVDDGMMTWPERAIDKVTLPSDTTPSLDSADNAAGYFKDGARSANNAHTTTDSDNAHTNGTADMDSKSQSGQVPAQPPAEPPPALPTETPGDTISPDLEPDLSPTPSPPLMQDGLELQDLRPSAVTDAEGTASTVEWRQGQMIQVMSPNGGGTVWCSGEIVATREGELQIEYRRDGDSASTVTREWISDASSRIRNRASSSLPSDESMGAAGEGFGGS